MQYLPDLLLSAERNKAKVFSSETTVDSSLAPQASERSFAGLFFAQNPAKQNPELGNVSKIGMLAGTLPCRCICEKIKSGYAQGLLDRLRTDRWQSKPMPPAMYDRADLVNIVSNAVILKPSEEIRKWSQPVNRDYLRLLFCS